MIEMNGEDAKLLVRAVKRGEAVLFLGAGASATSLSRAGEKVMQGGQLAAKLAEMGGLKYHDEPLPIVVTAVVGARISRQQFENVLREEFRHCEPSTELNGLMAFTWVRLYTWNLDDTITNCRSAAQRLKTFNGLADPVSPNDNISYLQVVHLHGEAWKPEHGYIFSEADYNASISKGHAWYRAAAADYVENVPIFVGSKLKEPILSLELDRARPRGNEGLGIAFLVTPDEFTPIQLAELEARGICVVSGYLSDFVDFLREKTGVAGISPILVTANRGATGKMMIERGAITPSDLGTAKHLRIISDGHGNFPTQKIPETEINKAARHFLEGMPPDWSIVYSNIAPILCQVGPLQDQLEESFLSEERLFVVYGQSGSGKSTAIMQALKLLAGEREDVPVYELDGNIPSLRAAVDLLARIHPQEKVIVYFGESFIFGDSFSEDILSVDAGRMLFVGDARTSEWRHHIRRRLEGVNYRSFEFQRFSEEDYDGLTNAILKYVPAPRFHRMTPAQRRAEFEKSKSQLLIAMKEITQARKFREIIAGEYNNLPDDDCRAFFLISGLATLARSGVGRGMANEAYQYISKHRSFNSALSQLEGIVSEDRNGRLVARHEVYVRHIVENVASVEIVKTAIIALLKSFTKFNIPVIKNVGRQDGLLFRFLLNHNFLRELFQVKDSRSTPSAIYEEFEVQFQRDGHFWLQYGQYLSSLGKFEDALPVLEKSIEAYPENDYAAHALADVQLRVAKEAKNWNGSVAALVGHAVATLENLHASRSALSDQYAIATLAKQHVGVLIKHQRTDAAKEAAKRYFDQIGRIGSSVRDGELEETRTELLHFLTHGRIPNGNTQTAKPWEKRRS